MASLFTNPLQALQGQDDRPNSGPLQSVEDAKHNGILTGGTGLDQHVAKHFSKDPMWHRAEIDGTRWNKSYPYQLLILEKTSDGYRRGSGQFTLPIPPQALSISTPFAISTTVTLGGVIEEHNGAPIRNISFQGTTGVAPLRGIGETLKQANVLQGIFAGTVNVVPSVIESVSALTGRQIAQQQTLMDETPDALKATGYYQFRLLQHFLESYVTLKKGGGGTDMRLALAMWKDQAVYLVTPVSFDVQRNATSPWEYTYNLSFRAWRRINLDAGPGAYEVFKPVSRDPNAYAQLMNKLNAARRVLQAGRNALLAVNGDVARVVLEPLREVVLFVKDVLGVAITAADLPSSIQSTLGAAVLEAKLSFDRLGAAAAGSGQGTELQDLSVETGKPETGASQQPLGDRGDSLKGAHPGNKLFEHPEDNFELFDRIRPSDLNLPLATQRKIAEERRRIRKLTRLDFERTRDQLAVFATEFADAVGAGHTRFNETYNRGTVSSSKTPTPDDFEVMFALNDILLEMNRLAASSDVDRQQVSTMEVLAGMATRSGIAFRVPTSKFAVPFPYGATLEQLAAQYLGDPNRWHEIVALNGLRQPYVDEEGFELPLLTNGNGNQVTVTDASKLYVGQSVQVSSSSTARAKRRITRIEQLSPGTYILTLDGEADMDRFDVLAQATLHAFLPDTVNSQMLIYIPSDTEPEEDDYRTKSIPGVDEFDPLIRAGGVDLLLTQNGDLAITPDGDCRLATGLTNLIQRIRTALATPRGSLLHHRDYGLGLEVGASTADLDAKRMLSALQELFRSDPAFSGVSGVAISKVGPVIRVAMSVGIAGTNQTIPVSVDIRR